MRRIVGVCVAFLAHVWTAVANQVMVCVGTEHKTFVSDECTVAGRAHFFSFTRICLKRYCGSCTLQVKLAISRIKLQTKALLNLISYFFIH